MRKGDLVNLTLTVKYQSERALEQPADPFVLMDGGKEWEEK